MQMIFHEKIEIFLINDQKQSDEVSRDIYWNIIFFDNHAIDADMQQRSQII